VVVPHLVSFRVLTLPVFTASYIPLMCACLVTLLLFTRRAEIFRLSSAKTRIQAETKAKSPETQTGLFRLLLSILKQDGVWGLYRGFTATMVNTFSMRTWRSHHFPVFPAS